MSKRSERRAAERAAHKAGKLQTLNAAQPSSSQPYAVQAELATAATVAAAKRSPYSSNSDPDLLDMDPSVLLAPELEGSDVKIPAREIHALKDHIDKASIPHLKPNSPSSTLALKALHRGPFDLMSHASTHRFSIVNWESPLEMEALVDSFESEYAPETDSERRLVDMMARHYWLMQRALILQERIIPRDLSADFDPKRLALFMRYHDTHERSYYRAAHELHNLRKHKAKEQIGFESQKQKAAAAERNELRRQELNDSRVRLNKVRTEAKELDTNIRQVFETPELGLVVPKFLKNSAARHPSQSISRTGV